MKTYEVLCETTQIVTLKVQVQAENEEDARTKGLEAVRYGSIHGGFHLEDIEIDDGPIAYEEATLLTVAEV